MQDERAKEIVRTLSDIDFFMREVQGCPVNSTFSQLSISYNVKPLVSVGFLQLFNITEETLKKEGATPEVCSAVDRLLAVLNETAVVKLSEELRAHADSESRQFISVLDTIVVPLCQEVLVTQSGGYNQVLPCKQKDEGVSEKIKLSPIGIGSLRTWHGFPDAMCRGTPVMNMTHRDDEESSSAGDVTSLDAKRNSSAMKMDQVIGHAVVMSFTMHNRHPAKNPLYPALLLSGCGGTLGISLYDCKRDVLLHTGEFISWIDVDDECFKEVGVVVLWATLHHRLFLKSISREFAGSVSTTSGLFQKFGDSLRYYHQLDKLNIARYSQVSPKLDRLGVKRVESSCFTDSLLPHSKRQHRQNK